VDRDSLLGLLMRVQDGTISPDEALEHLAVLPFEPLDGARVDLHRALRQGVPEVVYGEGKTATQIASIMRVLLERSGRAVATRVGPEKAAAVLDQLPEALYADAARMLVADPAPLGRRPGVAVLAAGTSDLPVAAEAALTAEVLGNEVLRIDDVGVAGLHRLVPVLPEIRASRAVVVVAGMDGALPSVVGGLVSAPVIAVPTSVGYGASFGGMAALLTMLNSCSPGVAVVNIDNGFGAGVLAAMINRED